MEDIIIFNNGSVIYTMEQKPEAYVHPLSRHEVYAISKNVLDYTEIPKEQAINALLRFKKVYAIPNNKGKLMITKNINDSKYILRLLVPFKDHNMDSYFVLVSSDNGVKDINDFYDYQELILFMDKYRLNLS